MKIFKHRENFICLAQLVVWLAVAFLGSPMLRAQPTEETVQNRLLFIFDTSSDMKPRVDAVKKTINTLLANSLGGHLHAGNSIGAWSFAKDLQTSEFPLQTWNPDTAVLIASNITRFVEKRHYSKSTQFETLQPLLNRVVHDSERLTIILFCDGDGKMTGTPYDDAINRVFQDHAAAQKKAREPIVIVLRSQLGEYVGAGAGLPPRPVSLPAFPPLPKPPAPKVSPPEEASPPPPPVVQGKPLIIIGTKPPAIQPVPPPTNPPPAAAQVVPVAPTNAVSEATNPVVAEIVEPVTNHPPPVVASSPPEASAPKTQSYQSVIMFLIGVVVALGLVLILRPRRKKTSLITRSMDDR